MNIIDTGLKFAYVPGVRSTTSKLVLHHAAGDGSVEAIHKGHLGKGWAGIGYHYYVRKDGTIYKGRPENWIGGHTQGHNSDSIGICAEGNFENETMSQAQKLAIAELVGSLKIKYPGILVYKHSTLQATACPGSKYPFDEIVSPKTQEPQDTDPEDNGTPSEWASDACDRAVKAGIFVGDKDEDGDGIADTDSNIRWHDNITREELALILNRCGLLEV